MNNKRPFANVNIMEKIDTEEKAYWLGFLYADGCVGSKEDKIELGLAEKDYDQLVKFKNFIGLDNKISYREKTKSYRYAFRSKKFKQDLIKQGCFPKKSLILKFPTLKQVPKELQRHFIRGYFDGDGWFSNTNKTFQVGIIGTEDFILGFLEAAPFLKGNKIFDVHRKDGAKRYVFSAKDKVNRFFDYIYKDCNIYLTRKYNHYLEYINESLPSVEE